MLQNAGEAPVVYSALKLNRTKEQIIKHLFNKTKLAISIDSGYVEIERLLILAADLDEEISKLDEEATNLLQ